MGRASVALVLLSVIAGGSAIIVRTVEELAQAKKTSQLITLMDVYVPPMQELNLRDLLPGTIIEFGGWTRFGFAEWSGPLITVTGQNIRIRGQPGHNIDCDGGRWWDGKGGKGGKIKPRFFGGNLRDSVVEWLNVKNLPVNGFSVHGKNLLFDHIRIDTKAGDKGAKNTDAFDVSHSHNVTIQNCEIDNQDDCLALNSGSDINFINNICNGGHGISIAPKGDGTVVSNVLVADCVVANSRHGVRIKTPINQKGLVTDITYRNIALKDINFHGIAIHGNYGKPDNEQPSYGYPINNLKLINVHGTVAGCRAVGIWIWIKEASNWTWEGTNIRGGRSHLSCQGIPAGLNIVCGH